MNGIARASRLDVGFDRRRTEPEDPRDVGVALALPGQDHAFALARLQPGGAHLPKPAAVHDPPRRLKGEAADDLNGADIAPHAIGRSRTTEIARAAALAEHERGNGAARSDEHTSALQSLMRNSYAVFCLKTKNHY